MAIQLKTLIILAFLLIGCPTGHLTGGEPKFSTQQVRELWQICSISFRGQHPGLSQDIYFPICDCYLDHMRGNYIPEQVIDNMTKEDQSRLTQELKVECNPKIEKQPTFT